MSFHVSPETREFKLMLRHWNRTYICTANGSREQLFDLENDPDEMRNLIDKDPDITNILRKRLRKKVCKSRI